MYNKKNTIMKKRNLWSMLLILMTVFVCSGFIACGGGDDDGIDKKELVNNGGNNNGDNNGGGTVDVPHELLGAWKCVTYMNVPQNDIYVFNADGTGKILEGVNTSNNTAQRESTFDYTYDHQNSTLTIHYNLYETIGIFALAFPADKKMTLTEIFDGIPSVYYVYSFNRYDGSLPTVDGNGEGGGNEGQAPSTPTSITARVDGSSISISWQSVTGATSYRIYRSSSPYGTYSMIGTAYSASYRDNTPVSGYNYYKVSALNNNGESQQSSYAECNFTDDGGGGNAAPSTPTGLTAVVDGSSISISWQSVSGANSYKVYRSTSAYGSYSLIGTPSSASYKDYSPVSGYNYYKVSALNNQGESQQSSYASCNYSDGGGNTEYSPCPPTVKVSGTSSQTVTWTNPSSSGCGKPTSYEVYKRNPNTGSYELKKTTTFTSYSPSSSDVHPGKNMYGIKAINNSGSDTGIAYSQDVPLAKPSSFSAQKQGSDVIFTRSKVTWATGYQIFESSSASGSYYVLDEITDGNQTTLTRYYPVSSGTTRYFKIKAIFSCQWETRIYSDFSSYKSVKF